MSRVLRNPWREAALVVASPSSAARRLHRGLPAYQATPLVELPQLAERLGMGEVVLKDESRRLGLPAYKVLGAVWAGCRILAPKLGIPLEAIEDLEAVRTALALTPGLVLVTATDGNHGRGVARVARWLGCGAEIFLPAGSARSRLDGIASEGAGVVEVPGTYDDAVAAAAREAGRPEVVLLQDHGQPGYEEIPRWVAEGYETIFAEVDEARAAAGRGSFDLVMVQIGVGTLAAAAVNHYRAEGRADRPLLVGVEPDEAACALESIVAGEPVMLEVGPHSSIMAGLNCGTPSTTAWPLLKAGFDGFVSVGDDRAREAMRLLAAQGIESGESGAAGLAGLIELMQPSWADHRAALGIGKGTRALVISTEGATDPAAWETIVGRAPRAPLP
jgi:diaminopropionate ammonia-lyase